jgi:stage II sporulation protein P
MKRRRRNKGGTKFYMGMSILCLVILFIGYSYVYNLSEKRKSGQDITTISINYSGDEESADKASPIDKIMSYFNIFLEKTFKEDKDTSRLMESDMLKAKDVFKNIDSQEEEKTVEEDLEIYQENNDPSITEKQVYLADNRHENFFRVIESPTYRSSAPRDSSFDAASVNEKLNIVLFHTHATEAYLPHEEGNYRTQDERYNVMGVGTKITANLQGYGINAMHLKDYNDYPDYNSSYANSSQAVKKVLSDSKRNLIIDIHRDGADENSAYERILSGVKTTQINGKTAATCTLVIGDKNGNYEELKKNAQKLYEKAQEMYPGLFRDIIIRPGAYFNQYLSDYALLIEIGSTLNHIDEVNYSAELLSEILVEYIGEISK